jgi:hypothetical protein
MWSRAGRVGGRGTSADFVSEKDVKSRFSAKTPLGVNANQPVMWEVLDV